MLLSEHLGKQFLKGLEFWKQELTLISKQVSSQPQIPDRSQSRLSEK